MNTAHVINPNAAKHFRDNPDAKYWYYSPILRVPNPVLRRRVDWRGDPFPMAFDKELGR